MSRLPLHIDKLELFCNRCNKYVNKFIETTIIDNEVYCLHCDNWLSGEEDCFGCIGEERISPSITHIKMMSGGLVKKNIFIAKFLNIVFRKLNSGLPEEGYLDELFTKSYELLKQ